MYDRRGTHERSNWSEYDGYTVPTMTLRSNYLIMDQQSMMQHSETQHIRTFLDRTVLRKLYPRYFKHLEED